MANRKLEIEIVGDASKLQKELNGATAASGSFASKFGKLALVGGAVGAGLAVVGVGLKKTVDAAMESEKAQARLQQAMRGAGLSMEQYGSEIQKNIDKTSRLAALDDEDLSDAFAKLVRSTGDVQKATEGMNLAADIARSRNISLEAATKAVERAMIGNATAFSRLGVQVVKSSDNLKAAKETVESWKDSSGKLTEAEKEKAKALFDSAKELDKQATAAEALSKAQQKFAGGAKEYGETSAAAQERLGVAFENLQQVVGAKVLPVFANLTEKLVELVNWAIVNWPRFQQAFQQAMDRVQAAFERIRPIIDAVWQQIQNLVRLVTAIFRGEWSEAWEAFKDVVAGAFTLVGELLKLQVSLLKTAAIAIGKAIIEGVKAGLTGIGNAAWGLINNIGELIGNSLETVKGWGVSVGSGIKSAVVEALVGIGTDAWHVIDNIGSVLQDVRNTIAGWGRSIAAAIKDGVVDGIKGIGNLLWNSIKGELQDFKDRVTGFFGSAWDKLKGDAFDPNFVPPTGWMPPATGAVDLMGAQEVMRPFAQAAAGYGLTVTSGLRPGAITANGTPSDHGIGKALDVAGSAAGMAGFFRSLIGNPAVKQAFYDPLGSIFGGRQNSYIEGGHNDHVHVATYDKGGWLMPGLTLARNMTGRPERVLGPGSGGAVVYNFNFPNYVGDRRELTTAVRTELQRISARN